MLSRFWLVAILVFMHHLPFFQSALLTAFSILNCSYMVGSSPLFGKKENRIEIFNELSIYTCSLFITTFINIAIP